MKIIMLSKILLLGLVASSAMAMDHGQFHELDKKGNASNAVQTKKGLLSLFRLSSQSGLLPKTRNRADYDGFVDELQTQNKTVRQFVKEKHATYRKTVIKDFAQTFDVSDDQIESIDLAKKLLRKGGKVNFFGNARTYPDADQSYTYIEKKAQEAFAQHSINAPFIIKQFNDIDGSPATTVWGSKDLTIGKSLHELAAVPYKFKYTNRLERFDRQVQNGIIEHEIGGHMRNYHTLEQLMLHQYAIVNYLIANEDKKVHVEKFLKKIKTSKQEKALNYFHEYQADQDPASKNLTSASEIEKVAKIYIDHKDQPFHDSQTHPAFLQRYTALRDIRELLQAQHRWYMGPKGYEKYGQPAFERMWDKACEKLSNKTNWDDYFSLGF